ncbi:MAG: hypothetical protein ISS63_05540 [Desulfobacteraceae bacterium]|nr:hypothetical protein [Desulfobacteraceae bacterium]
MKQIKRDLQSVVKNLKSLMQKTEKIAKKLDKLEAAKPKAKPKAKAKAKAKAKPEAKAAVRVRPAKKRVVRKVPTKKKEKVTAIDTVFKMIKRTKKGVNTASLKKKTGFSDKKIWNIINRLKKQGEIKSARKGVYVEV